MPRGAIGERQHGDAGTQRAVGAVACIPQSILLSADEVIE
jgi:hypothetical protein